MVARVAVEPKMLRWARERAHLNNSDLAKSFPKIAEWENGNVSPTAKQLEDFARKTCTPYGYFFLKEPPDEYLPINDFRRPTRRQINRPSSYLLHTIYTMQHRSAWLREERIYHGIKPIDFVGSASLSDSPAAIGRNMRKVLGLADGWANKIGTWREAVNKLRAAIEQIGVMAVINGIVGNSTRTKLNTNEFLGFALCDEYAPLIFVNGADFESRKMFTLAHELAHIWLGATGEGVSLSKIKDTAQQDKVEDFCNKAAAEFLVPAQELHAHWNSVKSTENECKRLASVFRVSPIVIARRALDEGLIARDAFFQFYNAYTTKEREDKENKSGGGDFYRNQNTRVGVQFAKQAFNAAMEGRVGFTDVYYMTGLTGKTLDRYLNSNEDKA